MACVAVIGLIWTSHDAVTTRREIAHQAAQERCKGATNSDCQTLAANLRSTAASEASADYTGQQLWLNLMALFGLGATILYARNAWIEARKSAQADNAALEETRKAAAAQLRPYVHFAREPEPPEPLKRTDRITIVLKNFGQTPANQIVVRTGISKAKRPIGDTEVPLDQDGPPDLLDLAPGGDFSLFFATDELTDAEFAAFTGPGPDVMLLRVRAEYEYAPGLNDACDMTIVLSEDALNHRALMGLSRWERERE